MKNILMLATVLVLGGLGFAHVAQAQAPASGSCCNPSATCCVSGASCCHR